MTYEAARQVVAVADEQVTPGLLGFTVVVLLGLATWFLLRSMNKQLKKIDFEERDPQAPPRDEARHEPTPGGDAR